MIVSVLRKIDVFIEDPTKVIEIISIGMHVGLCMKMSLG